MTVQKHEGINDGEWQMAFADDGTADWRERWFLDGDTATVENTPQGMMLRAGPDIKDNGDSMVLWTRDGLTHYGEVKYGVSKPWVDPWQATNQRNSP